MGKAMSRLGGGIGTRGPGESKLESDRRHIRSRIDKLRRDLEQVRQVRSVQRRQRKRPSCRWLLLSATRMRASPRC